MYKLGIDEAAFHGFGLIRRDPLTFFGVALLLTGVGVSLALILIPAYARFFTILIETPTGQEPDPAVALKAVSTLFGGIGLLYLIVIPVYMVMMGALYRSLVFGKSKGWVLGLKLGMDELRAFLVSLIAGFVAGLSWVGVALVGAIVGSVLAAGVAAGGGSETAVAAIAVPMIIIAYCVGIGLMIWIGIRLSYAAPASVGEGRFVIFESWGMTKGRFWTLFLAYLILFALVYVAEMVVIGIVFATAGGWLSSVNWEQPDFSAFENISIGPAVIIGAAIYGVIATFISGAFFGVASRGYAAWKAAQAAP